MPAAEPSAGAAPAEEAFAPEEPPAAAPDLETSIDIPLSGPMLAPAVVAAPPTSVPREEAPLVKRLPLTKRQMAIAGAGAGVLLLIILLVASRPSTGTLVVTASDPNNAPVKTVEITVDGKAKCQASPCTVPKLKAGTHAISGSAAGYKKTSEQNAVVESGDRTQLTLLLVPEPPPAPAAKPEPAEPPPSPPASPPPEEEQSASPKSAAHRGAAVTPPAARAATQGAHAPEAAAAPARTPPAATGSGTLSVTSQPPAMVYVDGRALGETPRQISLPAGPHTVTVVNPDYGSKTYKVTIEPGKSASVGVNL
jgi:hypothetical protein